MEPPIGNTDGGISSSSSSSSSSSGSNGVPDAGGGGTPCQRAASLKAEPPDVTATKQPISAVPGAAGGALTPGMFRLRSAVLYTDGGLQPSNTTRITLQILDNNEWAWAYVLNGRTQDENLAGGRFTVSGTNITFETTCARNGQGTPAERPQGYSLTDQGLTFINDNGAAGNNRVVNALTFGKF